MHKVQMGQPEDCPVHVYGWTTNDPWTACVLQSLDCTQNTAQSKDSKEKQSTDSLDQRLHYVHVADHDQYMCK